MMIMFFQLGACLVYSPNKKIGESVYSPNKKIGESVCDEEGDLIEPATKLPRQPQGHSRGKCFEHVNLHFYKES